METKEIAELIERVMTGDPWHGASVRQALAGLDAEQAAHKPVAGAHSVWELVLHMTGWAREVQARLEGAAAGEPAAGDWPAVVDATPVAWERDRRTLFEVHTALAAAIRRTPPAQLDEPVIDHRDRAAGTGMSKYLTLHGVVHHTVYHAGQIALLRRALD